MTAGLSSPVIDLARWRQRAACAAPGVDPELFFPLPGQHGKAARAKRVCAGCPVKAPCLADALAMPAGLDEGIRAGTTREERHRLRGRAR
jgi:WhiB family transcriptional regulator, redox-sensing transcriptional regulator